MSPILASLTAAGIDDIVVWNNAERENLAVYGRYAAIAEAKHDVIYVQDDDVIVSNPWDIVSWLRISRHPTDGDVMNPENTGWMTNRVVCNMPEAHRSQPFYREHALVGFGAVFHRDAPQRAFSKYWANGGRVVAASVERQSTYDGDMFHRRCDVVFTALTPRVLVDVPIRNLPYYDAPNRSWKQPEHFRERKEMLRLALEIRDNG